MRESNIVLADLGSSRVPLLGSVPAGDWKASLDDSDHEIISTHLKLGRNAFATRIQGRSMEPEFKEGDVVIIDPNLALHPGDYVIAQNHSPRGEGATFKKYRPKGLMGGVEIFELIPLNPDFETLRSDEYQIEIIGVMVEHRRFRRV
jgi:SOS-response transcriptional repressor LexA